jgi:hypothetical protein
MDATLPLADALRLKQAFPEAAALESFVTMALGSLDIHLRWMSRAAMWTKPRKFSGSLS